MIAAVAVWVENFQKSVVKRYQHLIHTDHKQGWEPKKPHKSQLHDASLRKPAEEVFFYLCVFAFEGGGAHKKRNIKSWNDLREVLLDHRTNLPLYSIAFDCAF